MTTTINPLQIVGGPAEITFNSVDPGPTIGGVLLKTDVTHNEVFVDQSTMLIKKLAKQKKAQVEFVLAHNTIDNLKLALGSSASGFGGNNASPEYPLVVTGVAPSAQTRTFTFHKASVNGSMDYKNEMGEVIGLKVTLDVIADTTQPADQQLFTFSDAA